MRRFASLLFKRKDKSGEITISPASNDARPILPSKSSKRSRLFKSLSAKAVQSAVIRDPPPASQHPLQAYSSSSSSTESPTPATPDDDSEIGPGVSSRTSNQWSEGKLALPLPDAGGLGWDPHQNPSLSLPTIARSPDPEDLDDGLSTTSSSSSISPPLSISPHTSLHSLTTYALVPTCSAPPLLHLLNVPQFPRSSNCISALPRQETMVSTLHRAEILRRLAHNDLTVSEERSIASFTPRRAVTTKSQFLLSKSDVPGSDVRGLSNVSQGLKRWISRPCFEDRMSVYTPGPSGRSDDVVVHNVCGGVLGVAALEVSGTIEVLAGYNVEEESETPWLPTLSSSVTDLHLPTPDPITAPAPTAQTRNQPYKATPSPLRIENTPSPDQTRAPKPIQPPLQSSLAPVSPSPTVSPNVTSRAKRARSSVRFDVEEKQDKDDYVPLGHIKRIKRGREERAKFLELEKERRALEEEKLKHEAEKRRWEQEKRAWEAERKVVEEEKKKRMYQHEVIAARKRRDSQMLKVGSSPTDLPEIEPQSSQRQGSYPRPAYDSSRRQNPDGSPLVVPHPPPRNDSFNSLRGTSKSQSLHSARPPSLNSSHTVSSIEDPVKTRTRRTSMLPETPPQLPMMMQPYGYPWGMPVMPQMQMQMVPQMPCYPMDNMPLLPPTAPFMMQQTSDRRRSTPNSPNKSSTSLGKSASQSTDRLPLNQGASSIRRSAEHQRSSSGGSSPKQHGNGQRSNRESASSSQRSSRIVNDPNQRRNPTRPRLSVLQAHPQGSGSWVVPPPVPQRRQNTVS